MNDRVIIYGLFDPRNAECFYIGKTKRKLEYRLSEHLFNKSLNPYKHHKINQILKCGLKPVIASLLEIENYYDDILKANFWEYVEMYFIKYAKEVLQCPLVNIDKGGKCNGENNGKPVLQFSKEGNFIKKFNSQTEAKILTGICDTNIGNCCKGTGGYKSAGGFQWCYEGNESEINMYKNKKDRVILQFSKVNKFIKFYNSIRDAKIETNINYSNISECCKNKLKSAGGYIYGIMIVIK